MTEVSNVTYTVKAGDTLWSISKATGKPLDMLKKANPTLNPENIKIGEKLSLGETSNTQKTSGAMIQTPHATGKRNSNPITTGIMTQEKYEANEPDEVKELKNLIKKSEGKVQSTYIAPEGKATIGHGHLMINKPNFLLNIEKQQLTPAAKNIRLKEALKNPQNAATLKTSIQKDLQEAIKITGIKNVPSTVNQDLKLTDAQINLLLNSDIKKAQNLMEKGIGKNNIQNKTKNQKLAVLDLYYNVGDLNKKAPSFVKYFKENNIPKAQAELDFFRSDGKFHLGLIRRNYERMELLSNHTGISKAAQDKLLYAYNKYCTQNGKMLASNYTSAEKRIR